MCAISHLCRTSSTRQVSTGDGGTDAGQLVCCIILRAVTSAVACARARSSPSLVNGNFPERRTEWEVVCTRSRECRVSDLRSRRFHPSIDLALIRFSRNSFGKQVFQAILLFWNIPQKKGILQDILRCKPTRIYLPFSGTLRASANHYIHGSRDSMCPKKWEVVPLARIALEAYTLLKDYVRYRFG
jgi:hypothetical protein